MAPNARDQMAPNVLEAEASVGELSPKGNVDLKELSHHDLTKPQTTFKRFLGPRDEKVANNDSANSSGGSDSSANNSPVKKEK